MGRGDRAAGRGERRRVRLLPLLADRPGPGGLRGALHDPDGLAELLEDFDERIDGDGEELGYAADEAYEQLTGVVAPDLGLPPQAAEPLGSPVDFEDDEALAARFPGLWDRFGPR